MEDQSAPVKVGEQHEVLINAVGEKGDGIARVRGFVLFVPGVAKGDYVKIRITKVLPKVGFAEVVEKLEKPANFQPRSSKYANVTERELRDMKSQEEETHYEDTEDF
ncbi:TRAM domain-containing protein [Candidatus Woesearchaeota archaeon]|nr:TRAM domain-containing protein [Candidatus Woesearchaeota archaeon]